MLRTLAVLCAAASFVLFGFQPGRAQTADEYFKGKTVDLYIGYSVGGGYDVYGRMVARHIGKHLPGRPAVVPKNMEGAGSLRLANWLAKVAPKDGTAFGIISRSTAFDPLFGYPGAQFTGTDLNWIGSANNEVSVCVSMVGSGVSTIEEARAKELTMGASGPNDDTGQFPKVINALLGTKFKVVTGYPGGNDVVLAMERGEVQGRCGWSWSSLLSTHKQMLDSTRLHLLLQTALNKHPDLPDVPVITELAQTDEQKQMIRLFFARQVMGRPFVAPPGLPEDRLAALRKAFMDTLKDPEFLAEAEKAKLEINPVPGNEVQDLVREIYKTPPEVAKRAAALVAAN
jgi:tripartite-type tricarboxylate transporter receptor subunit TctC